jgi:hypothetical protein
MARVKREKPQERERKLSDRHIDVHLVPPMEILHAHVTEALCQEVFGELRTSERQRKWSLFALARFWLAVVLKAPPSLSQLLQCMRGRELVGFLPEVSASAESFFMKCKDLSHVFFGEIHRRFIERILPEAPKCFAGEVAHLQKKFTDIVVIDGSRLDKVRHRLKILWGEKAAVLPGCILAVYDLFRGITRQVWFDGDAAASEFTRATLAVQCLEKGTLVLADRLYGSSVELFALLEGCGSFGVFRRAKTLPVNEVRRLHSGQTEEGLVEDWLVEAGRGEAKRQLRLIRLTRPKEVYEALTSVLEPGRLSAEDVVRLYPLRWSVERLFFDLKVVLNLEQIYATSPNAVAMQVFAAAMVHAAFRIAQAHVAKQVELRPEEISSHKLFPLLAFTSIKLVESEFLIEQVCKANRGVKLNRPSLRELPGTVVSLKYLRVQRRGEMRKQRGYDIRRRKWKSFTKIRGAEELT